MICPVCKTELGFELPDVEDFYYDCPVCNSSLSFHDGKCEVISQAEWPPKESQQSSPQNQSPLEANIIKPTPAELNSKVAEGEFDSEQLDRKQSHGEQVSVGKSNLEATDRGQLNREYEENPDDLDLNQPLNESEKMQSDAEQFNPENRSQTPFEESSYRGEDDRGESTPINQMERGQDEREQPLTDQGDFNEAPEVTEVPDIGEEPSEFIQSSKEELPQEDLAQEELLQQEPAQEEHSEEELQQEEPSFVFKEGIESEEPVKEDFSEVVEFSKKKEKKGLYLYRLFLTEINSQALKDKVISLLEDASLEIDLEEYPSYREEIIQRGKIVLSKLSPIQVYVILHHLMGLPLKVHWEQSHIADS